MPNTLLRLSHPARGEVQNLNLIFSQRSESIKKIQFIDVQENITKIERHHGQYLIMSRHSK